MLHPLEICPFGDWQALQVAAQAVEAELDGAEAYPVAPAIDAGSARFNAVSSGDREMDAAAEIDAVRSVVDFDEHRERVAGAGLGAHRAGDRLRGLAADFARDQPAVEAQYRGDLGRIARDETAAK